MNGALIIDKPAGLTSHDAVAAARRLLRERSIGHLGTLDPAATGVLPLLVGRLTRLARFFQLRDKEYEGVVRFGWATTTYDAEGAAVGEPRPAPARAAIEAVLPEFQGVIRQIPPAYSAKKIDGKRAYQLARAGTIVEPAPVEVEITALELLDYSAPDLHLRVRCSTGTYMRSLAHDLGRRLGMGAHLSRLRRTRVGEFTLADAVTLAQLELDARQGLAAARLLPARQLLPEMPAIVAPPEAAARLLQGRAANLPEFSPARRIRIFTAGGDLLAIGARVAGSLFQPELVFPPECRNIASD